MAFNKGDKADSTRVRRGGMHRRKKVCVFCGEKNGEMSLMVTDSPGLSFGPRYNGTAVSGS